jgi:hypothetical protein
MSTEPNRLYIDRGNVDLNKLAFDALEADKTAIEAQFGEPLVWERLDERRASRVAIYRPGTIYDDPTMLADVQQWMIQRLLRMKKVLGPHLAHLAQH